MTTFTDPVAAVEEATFLAAQTGRAHAVVSVPDGYAVLPYHRAHGMRILEVVHEVDTDE